MRFAGVGGTEHRRNVANTGLKRHAHSLALPARSP
jgi:hypothetical protein